LNQGKIQKDLAKKVKITSVLPKRKKGTVFERKAGILEERIPFAECYGKPKRTGLPVAGQAMR
jgi:hypothetical protein